MDENKSLSGLLSESKLEWIFRLNVAVLLGNNNWELLICQRAKDKKFKPNLWHLPWWKVEEWESIEMAIIREIKEELNLDIIKIWDAFDEYHNYKDLEQRDHRVIFVIAVAKWNLQLDFENQNYIWCKISDINKYFKDLNNDSLEVCELNRCIFNFWISRIKCNNDFSDISTILTDTL